MSIGTPIPALALPDTSGSITDLSSYKGKNILLTFYTTWSKSCADNLKFQKAIADTNKGIEVVAVAFDNKLSNVRDFLSRNGLEMTSLIDKKNRYLNEFHILIIPTTFLIDKTGTIKGVYVDFDNQIKSSMIADAEDLTKEEK